MATGDVDAACLADELAAMRVDGTPQCKADIIAFFAHKGGVSKTTNVYHFGYMLAKERGKKVILVDADPQCNLTQTLCKKAKHQENFRGDIEMGNLYKCVEAAHHGMLGTRRLEPAKLVAVHKRVRENGGDLLLLPGSLELAKIEPQVTFAHNVAEPEVFPIFDDIAGLFRRLFTVTANAYDADVVLIDMGPSIGEMNKNLFWSSDYFIIPCSPDAYCKTTMITMERTLPTWAKQQRAMAEITKRMRMPLNPRPPRLLGILMSLFNVTGKDKRPVKDSKVWMDIVKQQVRVSLVPALQECGMVHPKQADEHCLAEIPHFLSLMPLSQRLYCPVFDLQEDKLCNVNDEGELVTMPKADRVRNLTRAAYFHKLYSDLTGRVLSLLAD